MVSVVTFILIAMFVINVGKIRSCLGGDAETVRSINSTTKIEKYQDRNSKSTQDSVVQDIFLQ